MATSNRDDSVPIKTKDLPNGLHYYSLCAKTESISEESGTVMPKPNPSLKSQLTQTVKGKVKQSAEIGILQGTETMIPGALDHLSKINFGDRLSNAATEFFKLLGEYPGGSGMPDIGSKDRMMKLKFVREAYNQQILQPNTNKSFLLNNPINFNEVRESNAKVTSFLGAVNFQKIEAAPIFVVTTQDRNSVIADKQINKDFAVAFFSKEDMNAFLQKANDFLKEHAIPEANEKISTTRQISRPMIKRDEKINTNTWINCLENVKKLTAELSKIQNPDEDVQKLLERAQTVEAAIKKAAKPNANLSDQERNAISRSLIELDIKANDYLNKYKVLKLYSEIKDPNAAAPKMDDNAKQNLNVYNAVYDTMYALKREACMDDVRQEFNRIDRSFGTIISNASKQGSFIDDEDVNQLKMDVEQLKQDIDSIKEKFAPSGAAYEAEMTKILKKLETDMQAINVLKEEKAATAKQTPSARTL